MAGYESLVLQMLVDGGILGLFAFLLFYLYAYKYLLKMALGKYDKIRCHAFCSSYLINILFTGLAGVTIIMYVLFYYLILYDVRLRKISKLKTLK